MSAWPGKFVLGLTGNIATGKSIVRKYLEHLGAFGIDADAIAHRAIYPSAPGFQPALQVFGTGILNHNNEIDRGKLAQIVFADPQPLAHLEAIIHPLVSKAIDYLVTHAKNNVIVIEAIKLIESGLVQKCDALWVTYSPPFLQHERLMQERSMSEATARRRVQSQPPQKNKIAQADRVLQNTSSFDDLWNQVRTAWDLTLSNRERGDQIIIPSSPGGIAVMRGLPDETDKISSLISQFNPGGEAPSDEQVLSALTHKAFLNFSLDDVPIGVVGWAGDNLVSICDEYYFDEERIKTDILKDIVMQIEAIANHNQCEISLLFPGDIFPERSTVLMEQGYARKAVADLEYPSWRESGTVINAPYPQLYFKHLGDLPIFD